MIELSITMTGRSYHSSAQYTEFNSTTEVFPDLPAALAWLKEQYGKNKRQKMYIDVDGKSKHVGYIYGFRNADYSHSPIERWLQQDWVFIREVHSHYVDLDARKAAA